MLVALGLKMKKILAVLAFAAAASVAQLQPTWWMSNPNGGLDASDTSIVGCTNGGYTGSGPCVRQNDPSLTGTTSFVLGYDGVTSDSLMITAPDLPGRYTAIRAGGAHIAATTGASSLAFGKRTSAGDPSIGKGYWVMGSESAVNNRQFYVFDGTFYRIQIDTGFGPIRLAGPVSSSGPVDLLGGISTGLTVIDPGLTSPAGFYYGQPGAAGSWEAGRDANSGNFKWYIWDSHAGLYRFSIDTGNGPITMLGPVKETDLLSAKAIATDGTGTHIAAPTVGAGDSLALQRTGSFTVTLSGTTSLVSGTAYYTRVGNIVTLILPQLLGTSNNTDGKITGIPAALIPTRIQQGSSLYTTNNSMEYIGGVSIRTDGTVFLLGYVIGALGNITDYIVDGSFTASGTKGIGSGQITYILD